MNNSIFADGAGYVRGRFVPIAEAVLPVTDWGFTRSDVVYDVVHVFKGGFFRLADHLDRFERSMAKRRIRPPEDRAAIEAILHRCVALTGLIDAYVAMVASRGRPRVAGSRRPADCENHLIAMHCPGSMSCRRTSRRAVRMYSSPRRRAWPTPQLIPRSRTIN